LTNDNYTITGFELKSVINVDYFNTTTPHVLSNTELDFCPFNDNNTIFWHYNKETGVPTLTGGNNLLGSRQLFDTKLLGLDYENYKIEFKCLDSVDAFALVGTTTNGTKRVIIYKGNQISADSKNSAIVDFKDEDVSRVEVMQEDKDLVLVGLKTNG